MFRLDGQVAVVTGASSGLGERFARVLHAAGAAVVVAARREDRLNALADEHSNMRVVCADVAVPADRERLIASAANYAIETSRRFGILVNNAGVGVPRQALDEDDETFGEVMQVNVNAVFALSRLAGAHFIALGGGSIVNIASMLGLVASAPINQASYVASKSAVIGLTRELGCQWARKGVRVNALAPGWFESEMTADAMFADERSMVFLERNTPMRRAGNAHELDGALLFLASDASSYVVGQTLVVDGGWTAR